MEIHFTSEQEAPLAQIATGAGTDAEGLVEMVLDGLAIGIVAQDSPRNFALPQQACVRLTDLLPVHTENC